MANEHITVFAATNFRNQRRNFGIKVDDRRRHMYLVGKTGMGKSTVIENTIINDIRAGHGVALVDPHGDLAEKVLRYIPTSRVNDVIYFNPADINYPVAFNILESVGPEYKHLVAYGLVGVFKKIWADSWGPRMEYILTNTILALLDYPGSSLLGVMRMLVDKAYRKKVVSKVTDPVVKTFWTDEFANYSEKFRSEAIAPIQNKVGQFLASSIIRNIVGQSKSTIEMREIMDNQKILIMNLSKGRVGEESSALLGAMMITKLQIAAMSRVDIPEEDRKDFYLYVDEFQNFATDSFAGILSEARKYRLCLIMAHQYLEQLGDVVKAAVFGNVGTIVVFRVGATDATEMEPEFAPQFTAQDLVNLKKYTFCLRLMIDGVATEPFSGIGLPPVTGETDVFDKIIRVSRERYARPRAMVEERILRWSGVEITGAIKPAGEEANTEASDEDTTDDTTMDIPAAVETNQPATGSVVSLIPEEPDLPITVSTSPEVKPIRPKINFVRLELPDDDIKPAVPNPVTVEAVQPSTPVPPSKPIVIPAHTVSLSDLRQGNVERVSFSGSQNRSPQQPQLQPQPSTMAEDPVRKKRHRRRNKKPSQDQWQNTTPVQPPIQPVRPPAPKPVPPPANNQTIDPTKVSLNDLFN
ncbi:MAG: type IV secretion system DNA-binding domain-containing protein [Candidatus Kerfeldbacteria bacterium]|nr:type IV secretion system DNA-binding domain-containing protein [Candidatus Kerfeldbacteria bacterium]